ncbi:MAG: hypothetical protein PHT07_23995 [Paludibacter sp.]|nr:hypothetical protein [Paludibacter sp.]
MRKSTLLFRKISFDGKFVTQISIPPITDGRKQKPKDLDFHITPSIVYSYNTELAEGKFYGIGLTWGFWVLAIGLFIIYLNPQEAGGSPDLSVNKDLSASLIRVRDILNNQIISCNEFLLRRNDNGETGRKDDPYEFISFNRGKCIGLLMARDMIDVVLKQVV